MNQHLRILVAMIFALVATSKVSARTICGTVLSECDSTAVVGATCRLLADNKFISGTVSDISGAFTFDTDVSSNITLEIGMTGYTGATVIIDRGQGNINLGNLYLSEGVSLDEVTVTGKAMIDARGRTVVFPSKSDIKASSTAVGLFQKLPLAGLEADPINRSLKVDGAAPMILINGVPSTMADVNTLQPKDIEKIEYSRITPGRYADRGMNGLINITLRKRNDGGQIYVWGRSAVATAFVDGSVEASYHQGASQFSLSWTPSWRNYQQVYDNSDEAYIGDDFRVDIKSHDRNPFNYFYNQLQTKYTYSPTESTTLSVTFSATPMTSKNRLVGYDEDSQLGACDKFSRSTSRDFAPSLDLFLRRDFNESNSLEAQVVGTISSSDYRRENRFIYDGDDEREYVMDADNRRRSLITEVSYTHTFGANTSLSGGVQNTMSHSTNRYLHTEYKPLLTENNNYVYADLGQRLGNVYLMASTGVKMFWVKNDMNRRHFIRNITTARASWNISQKWSMAASFIFTPDIPSLADLTDYPQQTSPYLVSNGNPSLKVSETLGYRIQATYQHDKLAMSLNLSMADINNCAISDVEYLGDMLFLSHPVNVPSRHMYKGSVNIKISDIQGFGARAYAGITHYENRMDGCRRRLTSIDGSVSLWWNKGPFTVSFWQKFPGKFLTGYRVSKDENNNSLSFSYKPDKHWNFDISWMYIFSKKGSQYPSWNYSPVNPYTTDRYIRNNANMVTLSVSYSADFGSIFRSGSRSLNNSDSGSSLLKM